MGRILVRIAYHQSRNRWVGKYRIGGKIVSVQLCTEDELVVTGGPNTKRNTSRRNSVLEHLYEKKRPEPKPINQYQQLVQQFLRMKEATTSYQTYKKYLYTLSQLSDISVDSINQFIVRTKQRGCSDATVDSELRHISHFTKWYAEQLQTRPITMKNFFIRPTEKTISSYSLEQIEIWKNHLLSLNTDRGYLMHRAVMLMAYAGLRLGEVNSIHWNDIELDKQRLWIRDNPFNRVKNRKETDLPLAKPLYDYLKNCQDQEGYLLKRHWTQKGYLSRSFAREEAKLGITGIKPCHGFRAFYSTHMLNSGKGLIKVQQLMRHSSSKTTEKYYDKKNQELSEAQDCFE